MKLLFCEDCGDIVAPHRTDFKVRWCECKLHAVWWENGKLGKLVVYAVGERRNTPGGHYHGFPMAGPRAWVIGLHNGVLQEKNLTAEQVQWLIEAADGYLFKTRGSLVIKLRPLESNDTRWSFELPETEKPDAPAD